MHTEGSYYYEFYALFLLINSAALTSAIATTRSEIPAMIPVLSPVFGAVTVAAACTGAVVAGAVVTGVVVAGVVVAGVVVAGVAGVGAGERFNTFEDKT